jgi:small-conductance mechanosensitive channel
MEDASLRRIILIILALLAMPLADAAAERAASPAEPPASVRQLLELLADPEVRTWLEQRPPQAAPEPAEPADATSSFSPASLIAETMQRLRAQAAALSAALPRLPGELARAGQRLGAEMSAHGILHVVVAIALFVALGYGCERLYWQLSAKLRDWIQEIEMRTVRDRLRVVGMRLVLWLGLLVAFAIGSGSAVLIIDWPPLLRQMVLGYLVVVLAIRMALVAGRFLFAPAIGALFANADRFRIIPMSDAAALFWHRRVAIIVGWVSFGVVTVGLLAALGVSSDVRRIVGASTFGLVSQAILMEVVWRRPEAQRPAGERRLSRNTVSVLLTIFFIALWVLRIADAMPLLWLVLLAVGLPAAIRVTQQAVNHILRPPEATDSSAGPPMLATVILERGLRAALIVGAVLLAAQGWDLDLVALTARDTLATRLVRGALSATVIVLVADFLWHVVRALIDRSLIEARDGEPGEGEEAQRRARLRTLLPIARNIIFIVLAAITLMMALAALGVEIGPLIAGAGVVGVAVGFGAQTLVRDVISGIFYLLDDAFRVGEYIQSGNYKGTVESFSLRSVKLRHHRGPLYTIPFGTLGAVQNMSRDWVIDKISIGITYDSDLDLAKKLIKQVGKDLMADPELAPNILQPLKMQGVEQFGDFAIQIRLKIMTKPGEQFVIRRRAYALIKKAFDANGVKFAFPTVQVAGGDVDAAVARQALQTAREARTGGSA